MKILGINGSHRKGKNTAKLLELVLEEASNAGAETELVELVDLDIDPCKSCHKCLDQPECSIDDDMSGLGEKLMASDGIVLGSPVYWANVSALMKNFMDRTRWMHMSKALLEGKIGGAVVCGGFRNGGQEETLRILKEFLKAHGLILADCRDPDEPLISSGAMASLTSGFGEGEPVYRETALEDEVAVLSCRQLGRNIVNKIEDERNPKS